VGVIFTPFKADLSPLSLGIFRTVLPDFKALEEFEWIGYPELQADMVQVLLKSHPNLTKLGLMYLSITYQFVSGYSHFILLPVDGTLTLLASLNSPYSSDSPFVQRMMTGLPTWGKFARCWTIMHTRSRT
jgi:hypothetical protein